MATQKGHIKRTRQNIRSTRPPITNIKIEPEDDQFKIKQEAKTHAVYALLLDTSKLEGVGYSDLAGPFPYTPARGHMYIFFIIHGMPTQY